MKRKQMGRLNEGFLAAQISLGKGWKTLINTFFFFLYQLKCLHKEPKAIF